MKNLMIYSFLLISGFLFSQKTDTEVILNDSKSFFTSFVNKDYKKILDLTYPAIFDKIDKDTFEGIMQSAFEGNEDYSLELLMEQDTPFEISPIFELDSLTRYAFVSYPFSMKMKFLQDEFSEEEKETMINMMEVEGMNCEFISNNEIKINKLSMIIALNDPNTSHTWKYVNYDKDNVFFVSLIPVKIIKNARDYYTELIIKEKENGS